MSFIRPEARAVLRRWAPYRTSCVLHSSVCGRHEVRGAAQGRRGLCAAHHAGWCSVSATHTHLQGDRRDQGGHRAYKQSPAGQQGGYRR